MPNILRREPRIRVRIWVGDAFGHKTGSNVCDETVSGDDRFPAAARHAEQLAKIEQHQPFIMLVEDPDLEPPEPPMVRSNDTEYAEHILGTLFDPETGQTLKLDPEVYRKQAGI